MKKSIYSFFGIFALAFIIQCSEPENPIYTVLNDFTKGAVIRTIEIKSAEFNSFNDTTFFEVMIEEQDEENGDLLQEVRVYISFDDNTSSNGTTSKPETLYSTIPAGNFVEGESGLPRTSFKISLAQALEGLSLSLDEFTGGDAIDIRFELQLTDGRIFTNTDSTGSLQQSFFSSPYLYKSVIKCIPLSAIPGIYTFEMADSYGDGWQESRIKVTVDGTTTYYGIPSPYDRDADYNASLETFNGNNSSGKSQITIPANAQSMLFEFERGRFPSECSFTINYTALDGSNGQTSYSESNPSAGEKVLSVCE
jgi:hypothetical protein